jgi:hypothetical protein
MSRTELRRDIKGHMVLGGAIFEFVERELPAA